MKVFIERTKEWISVEMIANGPIRLWRYEWRKSKYILSQDRDEDIVKKIINDINNMLDVEMIEDDIIIYRKIKQFKGRE